PQVLHFQARPFESVLGRSIGGPSETCSASQSSFTNRRESSACVPAASIRSSPIIQVEISPAAPWPKYRAMRTTSVESLTLRPTVNISTRSCTRPSQSHEVQIESKEYATYSTSSNLSRRWVEKNQAVVLKT